MGQLFYIAGHVSLAAEAVRTANKILGVFVVLGAA